MPGLWKDISGQQWEIKLEGNKQWHRKQGEEKWWEGYPPGYLQKTLIPLDQRPPEKV